MYIFFNNKCVHCDMGAAFNSYALNCLVVLHWCHYLKNNTYIFTLSMKLIISSLDCFVLYLICIRSGTFF